MPNVVPAAESGSDITPELAARYQIHMAPMRVAFGAKTADDVKESSAKAVQTCSFQSVRWIQAQGVMTTHGGPAAFGIAGFSRK